MFHFSSLLGSFRLTSSFVRCPIYLLPRNIGVRKSIDNGPGQRGVTTLRSPQTHLQLFALMLGSSPPSIFPITALSSYCVGDLKEQVCDKWRNRLRDIDPHQLTLWKLKIPIPEDEADAGAGALGENLSEAALRMKTTEKLEFYFPSGVVDERRIHILVQAPSLGQRRGLVGDDTDGDALRVGMQKRRLDFKLLEGSETIYKAESDPDMPSETPQFPTASDFDGLVTTPDILIADKTVYIKELDKSRQYQLMFLRPPGWGNTTFLQMLANHYDLSKAHEFDNTFGGLYIGKNPTRDRSSLLVLLFDFSKISTVDPHKAKKDLNDIILDALRGFLKTNERFLGYPNSESLLDDDGAEALRNVLRLVKQCKRKLFVGVDEYDAPASAFLFSDEIKNYHAISHHFQTRFFAIIKQAIGFSIQKYWVTGVLPAFRDGFSPLCSMKHISMSPQYHNACGLTESEVRSIAKAYLASTHDETQLDKELGTMKQQLNGHRFYPSGDDTDVPSLYNPQLVFTHLRTISRKATHVHPDEERNTMNIAGVLNAIKDNRDMDIHDLLQLLSGNLQGCIMAAFGAAELKGIGRSADITWTLLYYFGVITCGLGGALLIPNLTMRYLVIRRFWEYLKTVDPAFTIRMRNSCAAFISGNHSPLVDVLEEFLQKRPERSIFDPNETNLQLLMEICWFEEDRCMPGLRPIVDPAKAYKEDCFGFVDLFVASSPKLHGSPVAVIELKQVALQNLCRALAGNASEQPSHAAMERLREKLKEEDASQILQRAFCHWDEERSRWYKSCISELLQKANQKVNTYLNVAKNGFVEGTHGGILDKRVICETGADWLIGHVVICIGDTRVITLQVGNEQTRHSFRKASIKPESVT